MVKKKPTKKLAITKGKKTEREIEIPIGNPEVQDGINPKGKVSANVPLGYVTIGTQIGATINMGDFQSARIDVFIQRNVEDNDESIQEGLDDISDKLHEELSRQSELLAP